MRKALSIITAEHQALAAVLRSILLLIAQERRRDAPPAFAAYRAMLFYIDEFPEQRHHRKESSLLFPKLPQNGRALHAHAGSHSADTLRSSASIQPASGFSCCSR